LTVTEKEPRKAYPLHGLPGTIESKLQKAETP